MIVGRNPRHPVTGDTVLSLADMATGSGTIVDTDGPKYKVYWRAGSGKLSWHTREGLVVPRLDYEAAIAITASRRR